MYKEKTNESQSLNTQKMSYFSDIDLATLHRSRLNERIQYKLSWFNRRQKYYIPPTNQMYHRENRNVLNKTNGCGNFGGGGGVSQKFGVDPKKPYKSLSNGVNFISEKNSSSVPNHNGNRLTTNRYRRSACLSNRSLSPLSTASLNGGYATRNSNHCDNSTGKDIDCVDTMDEITVNKRKNQNNNNGILNIVNNGMNEKQQSLVSSSSVLLATNDLDSQKIDANHSGCGADGNSIDNGGGGGVNDSGTVHAKCLSGDAISNRSTRTMTDKTTGDCHYPCNKTASTIVDQVLTDDLNLPHRKRSGTWP